MTALTTPAPTALVPFGEVPADTVCGSCYTALVYLLGGRLAHIDSCEDCERRGARDPLCVHRGCDEPTPMTCDHSYCQRDVNPHVEPCRDGVDGCCGCCHLNAEDMLIDSDWQDC